MRERTSVLRLSGLRVIALATFWVLAWGGAAGSEPSVSITYAPNIPPGPGKLRTIRGTASGVDRKECRVVIYAYGGATWYVQPWIDEPRTRIKKKGTWSNRTHGGVLYAALLVRKSYKPPATMRSLPPVGGEVLAVATSPPTPKP